MNKCKKNEEYDYCCLAKDNAQEVLEHLGFGKELCDKTKDKDGRYGFFNEKGIYYGFENKMTCYIPYGKYIVFDWYDREILSKEEFEEYYEATK